PRESGRSWRTSESSFSRKTTISASITVSSTNARTSAIFPEQFQCSGFRASLDKQRGAESLGLPLRRGSIFGFAQFALTVSQDRPALTGTGIALQPVLAKAGGSSILLLL